MVRSWAIGKSAFLRVCTVNDVHPMMSGLPDAVASGPIPCIGRFDMQGTTPAKRKWSFLRMGSSASQRRWECATSGLGIATRMWCGQGAKIPSQPQPHHIWAML